MDNTLAVFRGCSRLEYRNQNIKILRAVEGELTRASYRLLWVHDEVRQILADEPNAIATAVLVDSSNTRGLPVRQMMVVEHRIDEPAGFLHLTFSLGPFVGTLLDFTDDLAQWEQGAETCPPGTFVSRWRPDWPRTVELPDDGTTSRWSEAIDFLTASWDFSSTAFLRIEGTTTGVETGPVMEALENHELPVRIRSYNPHLTTEALRRMKLRVAQSGGLIAVETGDGLALDRDGDMELRLRCLEPGVAHLDVTVDPDPQFSTYLPLTLRVAADPSIATGRPRVLGREWQACLEGLEAHLRGTPDLHLTVLDLLARVFPDDPAVLQHKGLVHYREGRLAEARRAFDTALAMREDAGTVAWNLFAALRRGDVGDALDLLTRLSLSQHELFDNLIDVVGDLPEGVNLAVARVAPTVFGDEKALRLLAAMAATVESEPGTCELAGAIRGIDPERALSFLLEVVDKHEDWPRSVRLLVELADEVNRVEGIEAHARQALRWGGENPADFLARWYRFRRLLPTPEVRVAVSMGNVRRMFDAHPGFAATIAELALETAETALGQADLLLAQEALTMVFANVRGTDEDAEVVLASARVLEQRLADILIETDPVRRGSEEYVRSLYRALRPWTEGKTLVVLGAPNRRSQADEWEAELGVRLVWLGSTPSNPVDEPRLRALDPSSLIVVALYEHMSHLKPNTKQWLKRNDVPIVQTPGTGGMLLEALRNEFAARESRGLA